MIRKGILFLFVWLVILQGALSSQEPMKNDQPDFEASARNFIELLVRGDFPTAVSRFDETMKTALPIEKLAATWNTIISQAGAFKQQGSARKEKQGEYTVVVVVCQFERLSVDVRVAFDSKGRIAGLFFTPSKSTPEWTKPDYAKPNAFTEQEVTVGTGEWALSGTLTMPTGQGPFPAVILIHGSGPQDRDETIGPNKPFRDLAWGLASRGIAVLRYEKRTKQYAAKLMAQNATITVREETIDDALAAVALLRKTKGIDARRIFVLGHSLGGMLIPRIGQLDSQIAGFIVLAGSTRPLEDMILEQMRYIFSLDGKLSDEEKAQLDEIKRQGEQIKNLKPSDAQSAKLLLGAPASYWLDLRGYDPTQAAKLLKRPMLILQGERDYQVTMEDFARWKAALGSQPNVTFKSYPKLNHLFIEGEGKSTPSEYEMLGHVAQIVIDDIADWIKKISPAR